MAGEIPPKVSLSKRKIEKLRRRKRQAESIRRHIESGGEHISKKERLRIDKERLKQNLASGVKFCIDCSFEKDLSQKVSNSFSALFFSLKFMNFKQIFFFLGKI